MNLTLSVDKQILNRARKVAHAQGKSVNQLVRDYLQQITAQGDAQRDIEELRELTAQGRGRSAGWRFNREEIHERS